MPRPVPRRSARGAEPPAAEEYVTRGARARAAEEPAEEVRPRRGRGELPARGRAAEPEPEAPRRSRRGEPTPPPESTLPTVAELDGMSDADWNALLEELQIPEGLSEDAEYQAVVIAIEEESAPLPSPRRGRSRSDESGEGDSQPVTRGRRGRSAPAEEEEPPARGRGRGRGREAEEEVETSGRVAKRGMAAYKQVREATAKFDDDYRLNEEESLVKFLEDEPFAVYAEHGLYKELKEGQRVWLCLEPEEECPICKTGHKARAIGLWNIVVIPEQGEPRLTYLKAGPALSKVIDGKAKLKTGPMSANYYSMTQTDSKDDGPTVYGVEVVRERDLEEDWKTQPFTDAELDEYEKDMLDETFVKYPTPAALKAVVSRMRD